MQYGIVIKRGSKWELVLDENGLPRQSSSTSDLIKEFSQSLAPDDYEIIEFKTKTVSVVIS